ncbi:MAG: hydantoinase B/oxoprolinase family protein [Alphaproteobacteria bacterium]|nr:hydantoinase B/oxoprolinase family protein [Alphaproteobacteria bacterium]
MPKQSISRRARSGRPRVKAQSFDPMLMAVLASRLEAIVREMSNTVMKASRSAAITNARDMSCALLTFDHRLICVEESMPIHTNSLEINTRAIADTYDEIHEGDAYFNSSPYHGTTHHADMTLCVPVFCDGEPLFWAMSRSHHADTGAHVPTTMDANLKTVYEEGLHLPNMRFQENFADREDLIRMCRHNIRVSNVWYGDYRAQVGGCRVAERRLKELVERHGLGTIKDFIEAWIDYGRRRAIAAIRQMPSGTITYRTVHDPIPGIAPDGIPITAKVTIDAKKGEVTVDLRDNPDCVDGGVNLSETCSTAACRIGVFYNLDPSVPHNQGSADRIKVRLRDGCVVGRPRYPVGTSNATMGVNDRLINAVQCSFTKLGEPYGMAEGGTEFGAFMGVISGVDHRRGTPHDYINMVFFGLSGGPANHGHDGWVTYEAPNGGGVLKLDSVEMDEAMYPFLVNGRNIAPDSMGAGRWNGAPSTEGAYESLSGDMAVAYCSDGDVNPAQGVLGGLAGRPVLNRKMSRNGHVELLPSFHIETCKPGERMMFRTCAGGGYGKPGQRDPERVAHDVNRRWLSVERAIETYRVALRLAANGIDYVVDPERTATLRHSAA